MRPRGVPRGCLAPGRGSTRGRPASMRPRGVPRGCRRRGMRRDGAPPRFNEAAGRTPRMPPWAAPGGTPARGFNEAAGRTPRMPARAHGRPPGRGAHASMRPRGVPRGCRRGERRRNAGRHRASMRPRGVPRGCRPHRQPAEGPRQASMRPRGVPRGCRRRTSAGGRGAAPRGFNEAAGRTPRMPVLEAERDVNAMLASMRPRGVPRGCLPCTRRPSGSGRCARFNEAAGRTPRMPRGRCRPAAAPSRFNEAAGRTPRMPTGQGLSALQELSDSLQ